MKKGKKLLGRVLLHFAVVFQRRLFWHYVVPVLTLFLLILIIIAKNNGWSVSAGYAITSMWVTVIVCSLYIFFVRFVTKITLPDQVNTDTQECIDEGVYPDPDDSEVLVFLGPVIEAILVTLSSAFVLSAADLSTGAVLALVSLLIICFIGIFFFCFRFVPSLSEKITFTDL